MPQRIKDRATVLLLNARGLKNEQIAQGLSCALSTVRHRIHPWQRRGLVGLWDAPGKGGKPRYLQTDLVALETYIQTHPRSYNCKQLATILRQECQVNLSPDRIRLVLKKRGGFGKDCEQVHHNQNQALTSVSFQADLLMLKLWAYPGLICLKYADESGFERARDMGYSYIRHGQQHIHQPRQRGRRSSALGFLQPKNSFEYGLVVG